MKNKPTPVLRRAQGCYTQTELADAIGVTRYMLNYWIRCGRIDAPQRTWGRSKRLYYSADDIRQIKAQFEKEEK